jgi:hypothetical protein
MRNHSITLGLALIASVLLISLLFVSYRARAFHYCVGFRELAQARVVSADEPCSPYEQPLEWEILGWASKLKLVGNTIVKAVGAN